MAEKLFDYDFLKELTNRYGTPLYFYDAEKIRENIRKLKKSVAKYLDNFRIQYPIKTNGNPHILRLITKEGLVADCSSPAEVWIARKCGFDMINSTYTGNFETVEDYTAAVEAGMIVNLDDIRVDDLLKAGRPEVLSFRINPGIGRGGFEGIITGGTDAKFGIPYEKAEEAYRTALAAGFKRFGIHMMTGSNILEPFYFAEITQKLLMVAGEVFGPLGIQPEFVNIGGGLGIPYTEQERELDLDLTFRHVSEVFLEAVGKYRLGNPVLVLEPGRFLVGNAGYLISRVTHLKHSYRPYLGLDAGMNVFIRPALYKAYHKMSFVPSRPDQDEKQPYLIAGQICENSDIHPAKREIAGVEKGDFCVIHDAGAYGYAMASNYNHRPRPAEVLWEGGKIRLIRKADTPQDIFRNVPDFEW
ncbi:MAG: diaminopimelate decarboxylase [Calditrichia bacterium]